MQFNSNFIFGIADADLQVIGEKFTLKNEKSEPTMWLKFAKEGKTFNSESTEIGVDRYHKWREDLKLIQDLGVKHYRTSISMSRLLKENGEINAKAINWYKNYFSEIKKSGINLYATLYHWELPQYLDEIGGLTNPKFIDVFLRHTKAVVENLGEYIDEYFILNEPWCSSILSYYLGKHAPGEKNLKKALQAAHNLLLAQGLALKEIKQINKNAKVSTVLNVAPSYPATSNEKDILAAKYSNGNFNDWFLNPIFKGEYPFSMIELYGKDMESFPEEDMKIIKIGDKLTSLGLNYYHGHIIKYDEASLLKYKDIDYPKEDIQSLGWPNFYPPKYPAGLFDILDQIYSEYKDFGLKQIYVTENGIALNTPWDGKSEIVNDDKRIEYIKIHLEQVLKAVNSGVPVKGYFAWTLMDNYEWAEGYRPESSFGLIHVDRKSLKRIPKKSFFWYKNLIKNLKMI